MNFLGHEGVYPTELVALVSLHEVSHEDGKELGGVIDRRESKS